MLIFFSTASVAHDKYQLKAPEAIQFKVCSGHHFDLGSSTFNLLVDKVFLTYVDDAGCSNTLTPVTQALCRNLSHIIGIQQSPDGLNFLTSALIRQEHQTSLQSFWVMQLPSIQSWFLQDHLEKQ